MVRALSRLRFFAALLLLIFLFYIVNVHEVLNAFSQIRLKYLIYLILLSVVLIWVSCLKWQLFIRATGHDAHILRLMKYYTMAYFFNMFLPSSLGGDVARSVQLGQYLNSQSSAFAATFIERLTGFLAMILMGVVFVALGAPATAGVEAAVLAVAFAALLGSLICFSETLSRFFFSLAVKICRKTRLHRLASRLEVFFGKVVESIDFARHDLKLFVNAMVLSLAFHLLAVVNTYIAALAVGWHNADFGSLCMVVPLVLLVSIAPITPNAVGIQEGAFLFFLIRIGATHGQGLGIALLLRAKNILTALAGGLLWLASKPKPSGSGSQ